MIRGKTGVIGRRMNNRQEWHWLYMPRLAAIVHHNDEVHVAVIAEPGQAFPAFAWNDP